MAKVMDIIPPKKEPKSWKSLGRDFIKLTLATARRKRRYFILITGVLALLIIGFALGNGKKQSVNSDPVPENVKKAVSFPIYYPDQSKLPAGYILNKKSFSAGSQAVIYTVSYDSNKKIIFAVEAKPSDVEIARFASNIIPLHFNENTTIGPATIGAVNKQTIVSLPTNSKSWLLITAPDDINQDQLKQILHSLRQAN